MIDLSKPMTKEQADAHNMSYLQLTKDQYFVWDLIDKMPSSQWPESLKALAKRESSTMGWCGDMRACVVATWVRGLVPATTAQDSKADSLSS